MNKFQCKVFHQHNVRFFNSMSKSQFNVFTSISKSQCKGIPMFITRVNMSLCQVSHQPKQDNSYKITSVPSEDTDQPVHPYCLIRILTVRSVESQVSETYSSGQ